MIPRKGYRTFFLTLLSLVLHAPAYGSPPTAQPKYPATEFRVCIQLYEKVMLHILKLANTTTNRRERRVQVTEQPAEQFIIELRKLLGDDRQTDPKLRRLTLRDQPPPGFTFVTNTDYLPAFKVYNREQQRMLKGVIRLRNYIIVPEGTETLEIEKIAKRKLKYVKLADGDEIYKKLEFKVGHPETDDDGNLRDIKGVVDKPGVVLSTKDIDRLTKSPRSYSKNVAAVLERSEALTLTKTLTNKDGSTTTQSQKVNPNKDEVREMLRRIGLIHELKFDRSAMDPEVNMRYQRTAYKVLFKHPKGSQSESAPAEFEVQITIDKDIRLKGIAHDDVWRYPMEDRVIELKIPLAYANLSSQELNDLGLGQLAEVRALFLNLESVKNEGTTVNAGKNPNLKDGRGQYLGRFETSPLDLDD